MLSYNVLVVYSADACETVYRWFGTLVWHSCFATASREIGQHGSSIV